MKRFQRAYLKFCLNILLVMSLMTTTGCVALLVGAAAGAGGITYVKGALVKNVDYPVKQVHKASLTALKRLDLFVASDELNKHSAVINGEYANGKKVKIMIDALTERSSKIVIRFGVFWSSGKIADHSERYTKGITLIEQEIAIPAVYFGYYPCV